MQLGVAPGVTLGVYRGHGGAVVVSQALQQLLHHIRPFLGQVNLLIRVGGHMEEPDVLAGCIVDCFGEVEAGAGRGDPAAVACGEVRK